MAEKDITEKVLMSYADVFADCENVLTYGGEKVLKPEELRRAPTESFYKGSGKSHDQFCDMSFYWVRHGKILAQYMIENETQLKRRQVLRKASYEGGAYRAQLESGQPVYPVVSCVFEWTRKGSRIPLSLHKLLAADEAMLNAPAADSLIRRILTVVDDIHLTVHHIGNLPLETRKLFVSDMGFVADYLNEGSFENRRDQKIVHVQALCDMMEALTGDRRFTALAEELLQKQQEGNGVIMCEYIDMLEARGFARGEASGEAKGFARGEASGEAKGFARGEASGEAKGILKGENRLAKLIQILLEEHNYADLAQVADNSGKRHELYQTYGI